MKELGIIAIIKAKAGQVENLKAEVEKIIPATRAEKGCVYYNLNVDNLDSDKIVITEKWENYDLWQDHIKSEHMAVYREKTKDMVLEKEILQLTQVN